MPWIATPSEETLKDIEKRLRESIADFESGMAMLGSLLSAVLELRAEMVSLTRPVSTCVEIQGSDTRIAGADYIEQSVHVHLPKPVRKRRRDKGQ